MASISTRTKQVAALFGATFAALWVTFIPPVASAPPTDQAPAPAPYVLVKYEYVEVPVRGNLSAEERVMIERVVEGEAHGETYESKVWIATCIYNSMKYWNTNAKNVIISGGYYGYNEDVQPDTKAAVYRVFDLDAPIHPSVRYFYAPALCTSDWHESLNFVTEIGGHRFFDAN